MAEQHFATADNWALVGRMRHHAEFSCLLELRDRIEALENAQPAKSNHPAKLDSSLKERIKSRMIETIGFTWEVITASVIIEVAAWLRKESNVHFEVDELELYKAGLYWAQRLKQEAER